MSTVPFETLFTSSEARLAAWHDLLVLEWRSPPSLAAVERLAAAQRTFLARRGSKVAMLVLVGEGMGLPSPEARRFLERSIREEEHHYARVAVALLQQGFVGASIRAVFTGMQLVVRPPYPVKIFATVREAAEFALRESRSDAPVRELLEALAVVRA